MVKTTLIVYLIFYKLILFETLIIFIEPTIKLITGIFDLQPIIIIIIMTTQVLCWCFFRKDPHLNAVKLLKTFNLVINLSLFYNKAPNLSSAFCSEIYAVSNINLMLPHNTRRSYNFLVFLYKLLPLIGKRLCNLSYEPIYGLLYPLSYLESTNSH